MTEVKRIPWKVSVIIPLPFGRAARSTSRRRQLLECLQDPDLTRRVAFFVCEGCEGTWDALAEGSQADCWLLGLIGSASLPTMGLNSRDGT